MPPPRPVAASRPPRTQAAASIQFWPPPPRPPCPGQEVPVDRPCVRVRAWPVPAIMNGYLAGPNCTSSGQFHQLPSRTPVPWWQRDNHTVAYGRPPTRARALGSSRSPPRSTRVRGKPCASRSFAARYWSPRSRTNEACGVTSKKAIICPRHNPPPRSVILLSRCG